MQVDSQFIDQVTTSFSNAFRLDYNTWCSLAGATPINMHYGTQAYQKLYALKYIPAYYFEYCYLAELFHKRINGKLTEITIASLGCGLAPDYYALRDNLHNINMNYVGFEPADWHTRTFMPPLGGNATLYKLGVGMLHQELINSMDAFIFPKSIGDINNSDPNGLKNLAALISNSPKKNIFLLNSYVTKNHTQSPDLKIFLSVVHAALIQQGFQCKDSPNTTFSCGTTTTCGLSALNINFQYPSRNYVQCAKRQAVPQCDQCNVISNQA